jgi:hypothetical protein
MNNLLHVIYWSLSERASIGWILLNNNNFKMNFFPDLNLHSIVDSYHDQFPIERVSTKARLMGKFSTNRVLVRKFWIQRSLARSKSPKSM